MAMYSAKEQTSVVKFTEPGRIDMRDTVYLQFNTFNEIGPSLFYAQQLAQNERKLVLCEINQVLCWFDGSENGAKPHGA